MTPTDGVHCSASVDRKLERSLEGLPYLKPAYLTSEGKRQTSVLLFMKMGIFDGAEEQERTPSHCSSMETPSLC